MNVYDRMAELSVTLPPPPAKGGLYTPAVRFAGNLVYVSGCGPNIGGSNHIGKLGAEYSIEEGADFARGCMLNVLAALESRVGDLNRVKRCVKVLTFVACADTFYAQPQVANGGTKLLADIFGDENGLPARSAIGVNVLPGNMPVETEALFELIDGI